MSRLRLWIAALKAVGKVLLSSETSGRRKKVEPAMQPANTQTTAPSETQVTQPPVTPTPAPLPTPGAIPAGPAVPPAAEEPRKAPEVKTLDLAAQQPTRVTTAIRPENRPHAFVIMPFGKKKGADGSIYDFNTIYSLLIKPTLEMAGFEAFRADEETTSGDILTDMFQELLLADLCLVDMSIDNANVFYELGIRHAFRKRGIVHIQAGRAYMPFDIFNVRTIPYHITPDGVPDPDFLEKDKAAIARVTRDTWASDPDAIHSPVFNILTNLAEPDRRSLRTPLATGFWREYNEWRQRVAIARRQKRIGDILLLTEEISNPLIKEEALGEAGSALRNMDRNELALAQYRKGLEINSRNLTFRREEAFNLNRLGKEDEAIVKLEGILADYPRDSDAITYLGRIYKEMWVDSWKWVEDPEKRLRTAFDSYHWLIRAIDTYMKGFRSDLNLTYPGVNALTLSTMLVNLADRFDDPESPDPEIDWVRQNLQELGGSLSFALKSYIDDDRADYWTLVSMAELRVLTAKKVSEVIRAYRKALTASRRNTFFLQSSLAQLEMMKSLEMRSEFVEAGIMVIKEEIRRMRKQDAAVEVPKAGAVQRTETPKTREGYVFLFTGYMVNNAQKLDNHFPPEKEADFRDAILTALRKYNAGCFDLAVTTGMDAGSEMIFVECCVELGIPVSAYFPAPEAPYVRDFVSPGGEQWVERFYKMRNNPLVDEFYQPDQVGLPKEGDNVHERNNRWALYSALGRGIDKVRLIALWDGKNEPSKDLDARLVKHMVDLMRDTGGIVEQINPLKLPVLEVQISPPPPPATSPSPEAAPAIPAIQPVAQPPSESTENARKPSKRKSKKK
jgi:tetratricopeptide (TPR) repeat protein